MIEGLDSILLDFILVALIILLVILVVVEWADRRLDQTTEQPPRNSSSVPNGQQNDREAEKQE